MLSFPFDIETAKALYKKELNANWPFTTRDIKDICTVYGCNNATEIFDYLVLCDLYQTGRSSKDILNMITYLKNNDNESVLRQLKTMGVTFDNDDYKSVRTVMQQVKNRAS